jgi:hypothetical protein
MNSEGRILALSLGVLVVVAAVSFGRGGTEYESRDLEKLPSITFADPATVRQSAGELIRTGGDISMFACYSCHNRDEPVNLRFDQDHHVILEEHEVDFDLRHGSRHRNETCFNCHARSDLERLETRDGKLLKLEESTLLCGSCHGTTLRDWEIGLHGRTSGYWDRTLGPISRQDCTSCHDPHAPGFTSIRPAPGPSPLRPLVVRGPATEFEEKDD